MTSEVPTNQPPADGRSNEEKKGEGRFASLMRQARKQWNRRGIFEIDERHRLYKISRCIQKGIRECIQPQSMYQEGANELDEKDYLEVSSKNLRESNIKQNFEFRCYAPKVFACLRALVGVTEEEYLQSLAPSGSLAPCLEFITSSKSGMVFFLCNNKAFIIKTEKRRDIDFLRSQFLRRLVGHFERYPHSLLVKIVGCYCIKMEGGKSVHFTVMQSVFYPDERITERYDLKGCLASRYVPPPEEGCSDVIVLKDQNFEGQKIQLGSQASWLQRQVDIDSTFLEAEGIMDYSLLVGIQKLHDDEKRTAHKMADVVSRLRRSIKPNPESPGRVCSDCGGRLPRWSRRSHIKTSQKSSMPNDTTHRNDEADQRDDTIDGIVQEILDIDSRGDRHRYADDGAGRSLTEADVKGGSARGERLTPSHDPSCIPGTVEVSEKGLERTELTRKTTIDPGMSQSASPTPLVGSKVSAQTLHTFCSCTRQLQINERNECNLRLLPDTLNPLHIIDGEEYRYFIGIIDVLTQYGFRKKVEYVYKRLRYPTESFSTVRPEHYSRRFREYCLEKVA